VPVAGAFDADEIKERFGEDVATLVAGVARMGGIARRPDGATKEERATQAENLRKMLLAMVEDIRVVLIKLAERTQALRALMSGDAQWRERTAQEVLDLFAPLANRLGVWQLKWELEDLSLRALEPATYKSIAKLPRRAPLDRERYIAGGGRYAEEGACRRRHRAEVTGRPKHIYSIWTKMQRKQAGIEALYDIRAGAHPGRQREGLLQRIGLVHHRWTPLAREFDDYIAKPKANNYRSLHTAVIGPEGKPLEVQIRTREMHQHSEYGVASHWRYKEGGGKGGRHDPTFDEKIAWLRQVLDWKDTVADSSEWLAAFKESLFTDAIYVLRRRAR
jgi:GTP pyrophosphokinase